MITNVSSAKSRPYRIYKHKGRRTGRYLRREGKRVYIKTQKKMSDKALVNVMIKNTINGHRSVRRGAPVPKGEQKPLAYSQKIDPKQKEVPHTPFFSHNDLTKEKKLTAEVDDLKKASDKKDREHKEERDVNVAESKKATDKKEEEHRAEIKQVGDIAERKRQRQREEHSNELNEKDLKYKNLARHASSVFVNQDEKHKLQMTKQEMHNDAKIRRQNSKHAEEMRIVTEKIPPKKVVGEPIITQTEVAIGDYGTEQWRRSKLKGDIRKRVGKAFGKEDDDPLVYLEGVAGDNTRDMVLETELGEKSQNKIKPRPIPALHEQIRARRIPDDDPPPDYAQVVGFDGVVEEKGQDGTGEIHIGADGMGTSQIEDFLKGRTHHIIPCIPRDEMDSLLPYVSKNTKKFGFVFNSENHTGRTTLESLLH